MAIKAVQQIMLGTVTGSQTKAEETLRIIKEAGYDGVELNGFMIQPTSFMVRMLTKAAGMPTGRGGKFDWGAMMRESGLCVTAIHQDLGSIESEPKRIIQQAHEFHTDNIVITGMYRFDYSDKAVVADLCQRLNEAGRILDEEGISLLYHNHNCEFRKVAQNRTAYDMIIEETDPKYLNFELDSYWPTEAGVDALAVMKQLGDRMKLYHINDRGTKVSGASMTPILKSDSMELGYGNMNLEVLTEQALQVGVEAVVLESHKNWPEKSPIKSLQMSAEFMNCHVK